MSRAEWLRTFVAVYRSGSVTLGARTRGLSQPAASQHLASLSRTMGGPVLTRTPQGVTPTQRGRELYARIAEPLDQLEDVLTGLDGGRPPPGETPLRVGAAAELFDAYLLPRLTDNPSPVTATFGTDVQLTTALLSGETDLVVTHTLPTPRAALDSTVIGHRTFELVAAATHTPPSPVTNLEDLRTGLTGAPWVTYSHELPITRRFWITTLGRTFDADIRLTAPDLRVVATAVERGVGISLLPTYICQRALDDGRLTRLYDVTDLIPADPWFVTIRRADSANLALTTAITALRGHDPAAGRVLYSRTRPVS